MKYIKEYDLKSLVQKLIAFYLNKSHGRLCAFAETCLTFFFLFKNYITLLRPFFHIVKSQGLMSLFVRNWNPYMSVPSPAIMSYPNYMTTSPGVAASGAGAGAPITMLNVNSLLNQKDSRWLQLEVCREYQRQKCTRPDGECKFGHPPPNVEVQNGRVTACYDSIKVRSFILFRKTLTVYEL